MTPRARRPHTSADTTNALSQVLPPRPQAPDLSGDAAIVDAEQLAIVDRDGFGRISELRVHGGAELPQLRDETLIDVELSGVFSAAWNAPGCALERCVIDSARLGAVEMPEAAWESVTASGGRWGYVNLRGSTMRDVVLEGVVIEDLDLMEAEVDRLALRECRIGTLHLTDAQCRDLDVRGSSIESIRGLSGARGLVADPSQLMAWAHDFAQHLGIRVLGEGSDDDATGGGG